MGVLKAKVNGEWVPVSQGGGAAIASATLSADVTYPAPTSTTTVVTTSVDLPAGRTVLALYAIGISQSTLGAIDVTYRISGQGNLLDQWSSGSGATSGGRWGGTNRVFTAPSTGTFTFSIAINVWGSQAATVKANTSVIIIDPNAVTPVPCMWETGSYTPTLGNMAIGTGGSAQNTADYVFVGGPRSGDRGLLSVTGTVQFGTTGMTFPQAGSETITLPAAFRFVGTSSLHIVGHVTYNGTSNAVGALWSSGTNAYRPVNSTTSTTQNVWGDISGTVPFAWVAGNSIQWHANHWVQRV